jgi:transposase-like protein
MKGAFSMHKSKVTPEQKIAAVKAYLAGKGSYRTIADSYGSSYGCLEEWVKRYKENGVLAFQEQEHNTVYSHELKAKAVEDYLSGAGSLKLIAAKYGLRSKSQLQHWIKMYNSGIDFGHKMSGGSRMKKARKVTYEERIAIVKECLENGSNYGETAVKYSVSYQQAYTWVKKFTELGESGLEDRRGRRTETQEARTELEEMKIKMAKLEHELYITRMERDLLKKVDEIERRDVFRK